MTNSSTLKLTLLGNLRIACDGQLLTNQLPRKGQALVAYLAVNKRPHQRSILAELLWSDYPPQRALKNLRDLLAAMRPILGSWLTITRTAVYLTTTASITSDLDAFLTAVQQHPPRAEQLETALAQYQKEFLAGFSLRKASVFEEWVAVQREYLHMQAIAGLEELVDIYQKTHKWDAGLHTAQRLLALDPWRESVHRRVMQLYAAQGEVVAALRQYDRCCILFAKELGVKPAAETTALAATLRQQQEHDVTQRSSPIAQSEQAPPHNLPAEMLTFFGRQDELNNLSQHIFQRQTRLTSIIGLGGMGKTKLALAFARQATANGRFPAGVFFISLQAITTANDLWQACAEATGAALNPGSPPLPQLINHLRQQKMLLILDNFEHLLSAANDLQQLLVQTNALQILVTSRQHLPLQSAAVLQLHGLPYPIQHHDTSITYPALSLLQDRLTRSSGRIPSQNDIPALCQITRLTAGMPLALELAAAWGDTLSTTEIASELAANISVLDTTLQDIPPRQRQIHVIFDASWRHLSAAEQALMIQLVQFGDNFARKDAQVVTQAPLAMFASLIQKSFLQHEQTNGHYAIHPLIRQYCQHEAEQSFPELLQATREIHSHHYGRILQSQLAPLLGTEQPVAIHRLHRNWDNIRLAWQWAIATRNSQRLAKTMASMGNFCLFSGRYGEGCDLFAAAAQPLSKAEPAQPQAHALCLGWQAMFTRQLGNDDTAGQLLHTALHILNHPILGRCDTRFARGFIVRQLGNLASQQQQIDQAITYYEEALSMMVQVEDPTWLMAVCQNLGNSLLYGRGNVHRATEICNIGLESVQTMGDKGGIAWMLLQKKAILEHLGDFAEARLQGEKALALFQENGNTYEITMAQEQNCLNMFLRGDFAAAALALNPILSIYQQLSLIDAYARAQNLQAQIALHMGDDDAARAIWQTLWQHDTPFWQHLARQGMAQLSLKSGQPTDAARLLQPALAYWQTIDNSYHQMEALTVALYLPKNYLEQMQLSFPEMWAAITEKGITYTIMLALPALALQMEAVGNLDAAQYPFVAKSAWLAALSKEITSSLSRYDT